MKRFSVIVLIIISWVAGSSLKSTRATNRISTPYKVYKIDSINNWYLIYARKGDSLYKIVSEKRVYENCNKIQINKAYNFILHSRIYPDQLGGITINTIRHDLVTCFSYDDSTIICLERDSINDLHYASNLKGLCVETQSHQ